MGHRMRYTYFPKQELKFMPPEICSAPSSWMDGVPARRWVKRGFGAADSERSARPESPTSPNVVIGTYRGTKPLYPMLAGGL